ncbi:MAG: hypothetical protein ACOYMN_14300 [Roseimicrobium sp.]
MRPVPTGFIHALVVALCALCVVQWWRESQLRELLLELETRHVALQQEFDRVTERAKVADAEILRVTGALADLRATSVPAEAHEETLHAVETMRCQLDLAQGALVEQSAAWKTHALTVKEANEAIRKLIGERDGLAKRLNEVTERYNALVAKP